MLFKDFICTFAFATLASAAVAKQVPNTNWNKYAGERHHGEHHGHHAREAEPEAEASYNGAWQHANGAHGGAHPSHAWEAHHGAHHARDAEPEAAFGTPIARHGGHPTSAGSWTKPSDWASWWSAHPHPTPVNRGREHHARDAEPEAEPGFFEDLKKKFGGKPDGNKHSGPEHGWNQHHAREAEPEAEAEPGFHSGGANYDLNAEWHKKLLAEHGVHLPHHARSEEEGPVFDADYSEEGYGEPLHARHVEEVDYNSPKFLEKLYASDASESLHARDVEEEDYTSPEFLEKLYARDVSGETDENGELFDEHLERVYARDAVDPEDEHTEEEADDAYNDYLQRRGLDIGHITGPEDSADDDGAEVDEESIPIQARDARNVFVAGQGAHPDENSAKAIQEAHRRVVAAQRAKFEARDVEDEEADEATGQPEPVEEPAPEQEQEPEIE